MPPEAAARLPGHGVAELERSGCVQARADRAMPNGALFVIDTAKAETLTAAIAAWRAGQAPHLVQMFEVGTGSMLAAGPAVKQVWQLIADTGVKIDPQAFIPAVRGYYSLPDGRLASMPFNSSTAGMWYNKDAFEKAGLDPEKPPATWPDCRRRPASASARRSGSSSSCARRSARRLVTGSSCGGATRRGRSRARASSAAFAAT